MKLMIYGQRNLFFRVAVVSLVACAPLMSCSSNKPTRKVASVPEPELTDFCGRLDDFLVYQIPGGKVRRHSKETAFPVCVEECKGWDGVFDGITRVEPIVKITEDKNWGGQSPTWSCQCHLFATLEPESLNLSDSFPGTGSYRVEQSFSQMRHPKKQIVGYSETYKRWPVEWYYKTELLSREILTPTIEDFWSKRLEGIDLGFEVGLAARGMRFPIPGNFVIQAVGLGQMNRKPPYVDDGELGLAPGEEIGFRILDRNGGRSQESTWALGTGTWALNKPVALTSSAYMKSQPLFIYSGLPTLVALEKFEYCRNDSSETNRRCLKLFQMAKDRAKFKNNSHYLPRLETLKSADSKQIKKFKSVKPYVRSFPSGGPPEPVMAVLIEANYITAHCEQFPLNGWKDWTRDNAFGCYNPETTAKDIYASRQLQEPREWANITPGRSVSTTLSKVGNEEVYRVDRVFGGDQLTLVNEVIGIIPSCNYRIRKTN